MILTWEGFRIMEQIVLMPTAAEQSRKEHYELLGLSTEASLEEIDMAFELKVSDALAKSRSSEGHGGNQCTSALKITCLVEAYEAICTGRDMGRRTFHKEELCARGSLKSSQMVSRRRGLLEGRLRRLYYFLQRLSPDLRRVAINQRLSQKQRLELEEWMLRNGRGSSASRPSPPRVRTLGANIWHSIANGRFFAEAHLGHGLYAQSGGCCDLRSAVRALASVLRWRAKCQACLAAQKDTSHKAEAFARMVQVCQLQVAAKARPRIFVRARMSFAPGVKLSGPLRSDAALALQDWRRLGCPSGSLLAGAQLHRHVSPEACLLRWSETCEAWAGIWSKRKSKAELQRSLTKMEAKWQLAFEKASQRWRCLQSRAVVQLDRLLERLTPQKRQRSMERLASAMPDFKASGFKSGKKATAEAFQLLGPAAKRLRAGELGPKLGTARMTQESKLLKAA
eukprot:TRINITY_DN93466_c0_g1_i1.p1 TRINITY_DN93466_c0_g1~~TRINITY_DN93466_c0_g1_i1.p1  ORF type:complete len:453 (+),score=76.72 TRINITY_DN93466_c0_g1_i1:222-1580(+)